jgi:hypothetical protein
LNRNPEKRLGYGENAIREIKAHPFFKGVMWKKLALKEISAPFRPKIVCGSEDIGNFDKEYTNQHIGETPEAILTGSQQKLFHGFSYVRSYDSPNMSPHNTPTTTTVPGHM